MRTTKKGVDSMEDIIHMPVELIDQDLDEVAGGFGNFFNFDSNQGIQVAALFDNQDSNQGIQGGVVIL
jgi:hypothetical protein